MGVVTAVRGRRAGQGLGKRGHTPHTHTWCWMWSVRRESTALRRPRGVPRPARARALVSDREHSVVLRGEAVAAAGHGVSDL